MKIEKNINKNYSSILMILNRILVLVLQINRILFLFYNSILWGFMVLIDLSHFK